MNRDDALMCSLCQAIFRKVPPKLPPSVTGHQAWPRIQDSLDAARAAVKANRVDEARFIMDDALGLLPGATATALVVGLGRQWIGALRVDPQTRANLNAALDRIRVALDENRFPDAVSELKTASELTRDQASDVAPIVAFGIRSLANRAPGPSPSAKAAREAAPVAPAPPAAIKEGAEFTALAEEVVAQKDGPSYDGFGFVPDFSPASLVVLDALMDSMWGTSGEAPGEERWDAPPDKQRMIAQFGSYVGETMRRLWQGEWKRDERGPMWTSVALPRDVDCAPFATVHRRMKDGRREPIFGIYQSARGRLGAPAGEIESYAAHARRLRARGGPAEAKAAAAALEALADGRDPYGSVETEAAAPATGTAQTDLGKPGFETAQQVLGSTPAFTGIRLDATPASLIAIDGVLDELWGGDDGSTPDVDRSQAEALVPPLGAYIGEVAVRHFGGVWTEADDGAAMVRLPGGTTMMPHSFATRRLDHGSDHDLWQQLQRALAEIANEDRPDLDEAAWTAIADLGATFGANGRAAIAKRLLTAMTRSRRPPVQAAGHHGLSVAARTARRFDDAIAELDRALALTPDVAAWVESKGIALVELKRYDEACAVLEGAIALDLARAGPYYHLGNACRDAGRLDEAAGWYEQALDVDGSHRDAAVALVDVATRLGRHTVALFAIDRVVAHGGANLAEAHRRRGTALSALGLDAEAIDAFRAALDQGMADADDVWLERAGAERAIGRHDRALASLGHITRDVPEAVALRDAIEQDAWWLFDRAEAHARDGRTGEAIAGFRRVLDIAPDHRDARRLLASALVELGDHGAALAEFDAAIARHPSAASYERRGSCLARLGRKEEALPDYVRATEADPGSVDYWLVRAKTERDVGRIDDAKASWRRALALGPGLSQLARAGVHRQLWEAEHPGRTAAPEAAEPFRREANRLTALRCYADALAQIALAIELDPCDAESWRSKGTALAFLGRREEAVDALRQAVDYGAGDALGPLARLLVALHRWAEARPVVARLMEIDPRNPEYRQLDARCLEVSGGA